jgi:8-oxo-dGTP pyrophosphatase MutT (NUDIX family)
VLLTLHPKVGRWLQLGGHNEVEDGTIRDAARRETIEESGIPDVTISEQPIRLDRHPVPCGGRMSEHLDVQYLALVPRSATAIMSDESDDLQWFDVGALPEPLDASVRAMVDTALRG